MKNGQMSEISNDFNMEELLLEYYGDPSAPLAFF